MPKRWNLNETQAAQSVFNLPTSQFPEELQDCFDNLLDEFDQLRQNGDPISITNFLHQRLGPAADLKLQTPDFRSLIKYLIEIDLCYCFDASSPIKQLKDRGDQRYICFGQWAVDHAKSQRTGLLESLHRRSANHSPAQRSLKDDFIFKPTFAGGRFEVHERLGTGGMGTVFRICERNTSNEYALKTLKNRCPSLLYRLKREFRSLIALESHPNVILPHELFVDGADAAFTMELVNGVDFATAFQMIGAKRPLGVQQINLFSQLAQGLHHVHQHRWIHRDLKPSNVMVMEDHRVVLLDFGLVDDCSLKNYQQDELNYHRLMGTIHYLSPEQADGSPLTPASDWFSFGVLLYRCLTGDVPHAGDSIDEIIEQKKMGLQLDPSAFGQLVNGGESLYQLAVECLSPTPTDRPDYHKIELLLNNLHQEIAGNRPKPKDNFATGPVEVSKARDPLFIGRVAEIEKFERFIYDRSGPKLIEVVGESGIGKTGFLNRVLRPSVSDWVFRARCFHQEKTRFPGLDPIVDQVAAQLCRWPVDEANEILPQDTSPLLSLFPTLAQISTSQMRGSFFDLDSTFSHQYSERASTDFVAFIERLATKRSLCLVIDDFQWANQSSANLVSELISSCKPSTSLTVVLAYRPPKTKIDALNLTDVPQSHRTSIHLPRFSNDDGLAFLNAVNSGHPQQVTHWKTKREALVKHLINQASGSPLHLWEFVYQLNSSDTLLSIEDLNYQKLLRRRLARLTSAQFELMKIICASQFPFNLELATQIAPKNENSGSIETSLRHLEQEKFLTRGSNPGELEIYHSQISQCVRELVGKDAMEDLHGYIARLAEQQFPENYRLISEQYLACGLHSNAARALATAAESAKLRQSFEEAIYLLQQTISIANLEQTCSGLLVDSKIKLAETLANAGRCKQASSLFLALAESQPRLPQENELRRNAIFQHIFADQTNIDLKTTNRIAQPMGIKFSGNPLAAMLKVVLYRIAYSLVTWRGRDSSRRLQQRELIGVVARALTLTNPLLASSLVAKLVFLCKRFGNNEELENALDLESFLFKAVDTGKPFNLFGQKIVNAHLNRRMHSKDPRHRTIALLSKAVAAYTNENLIESLDFNDQALNAYRQLVDQSDWELEMLAAFRIWAYHYTGDFGAFAKMLNSRAELLSVETVNAVNESGQSVPRQVLQRLPGYFETYVAKALLQDDVAAAEAAIAQGEKLISGKSYSGRHHEFAFARHYYLMYVGRVDEALKNILYQKKMIWKIGYQLIPVIQPQLLTYEIVARTSIACHNPNTLKHQRRVLKKISKQLGRRPSGFRRGLIASIAAFEATCELDNYRFEDAVGDAIEGFNESGFFSLTYLLKYAAGKRGQTVKQKEWKQQAVRWAKERDIEKIEAISRIAAPAFIHN